MKWLKQLFGIAHAPEQTAGAKTLTADDRQRALAQIDNYVQRDVDGGFRSEPEIVDGVVSLLSDEFEEQAVAPLVRARTRELLAAHEKRAAAWPAITDCDRLDRAFAELEARGIVCRQDFTCCGTCGAAEIGDEMQKTRDEGTLVRGYAFYHMQDTESAVEGGGLYLNYGATEEGEPAALRIAHEICDSLRAQSLAVEWDGSWNKRIAVTIDWKRRRRPRCSAA